MFNGIGVSRGIGIAPARTLQRELGEIRETPIERNQVSGEIRRFQRAIKTATRELVNRPKDIIKEQLVNAEWAVHTHRESIIEVFEAMEDPYLATRKNDVNHVVDSVLRALQKGNALRDALEESDWNGVIVVADDLTPREGPRDPARRTGQGAQRREDRALRQHRNRRRRQGAQARQRRGRRAVSHRVPLHEPR